jgi:hypothetical protein
MLEMAQMYPRPSVHAQRTKEGVRGRLEIT